MAKLETTSDITGISGRLTSRESIYYRTNRKTGKKQVVAYSAERMSQRPESEKQHSMRHSFGQSSREIAQWYNSIKPTADHPGDPQQWQALMQAFDAQHTIGNPYTFAIKYYNNNIKPNGTTPQG